MRENRNEFTNNGTSATTSNNLAPPTATVANDNAHIRFQVTLMHNQAYQHQSKAAHQQKNRKRVHRHATNSTE
jgi:hypothetical protein